MKRICLAFVISIFIIFSAEAQRAWKPSTGSVGFAIKMMGLEVDGSFSGLKCNLTFDKNELSGIYATVNASTINTKNSLRDRHLKEKKEFFEPELYPLISLKSTKITKQAEGKYMGVFQLTIKNITKEINVPMELTTEGNKGVLKSNFTINRQNWNFGGDTPGMADNVKVKLKLNLI